MDVLVTGGAGFIGSHSVEALLDAGARVTVLDNFSSGKREHLPSHRWLSVIEGDIRDPAAVESALGSASHVLHLAAQVSVRASIEDPAHSASHNIAGFVNVADCARRRGGVRLVYASSAAVYGAPESLPIDESSPCEPMSPYGLEKLIDDQYARLYARLYGSSILGLRYFNVYGPRQDPASPYAGVISRFVSQLAQNAPLTIFGDGLQTRDFVFVGDVARANVAALRSNAAGIVNVGTGVSVSLLHLVDVLAACVAQTPKTSFGPAVAGDIRHSSMEPKRMREVLGFVPATALAEGLNALIGR